MRISFYDNRFVASEVGQEMGWESADSLSQLFRGSDLVTLHTSAADTFGVSNEGLLNERLGELAADRPSNSPRVFVNLARGNLYSSEALLDAVASGAIRRAAVDVYPTEPVPGGGWENPYAGEARITCTPHIGAATQEAQPRIAQRVATTIGEFSRYGSLRDCVFAPRALLSVRDGAPGHAVLAVVHSTTRGTKKAVDDAIYEAEASNLGSSHRDFDIGLAYDLSVLDRPLPPAGLEELVQRAEQTADDPAAIRAIRQIVIPADGW